jgi:hypothetical protein
MRASQKRHRNNFAKYGEYFSVNVIFLILGRRRDGYFSPWKSRH